MLVAEGLRTTTAHVQVSGSPTLSSSQIIVHFDSSPPSEALVDQALGLVTSQP
jgi:hypothetical protein